MDEDRDQPWNLHTCKFCSYRSKSTFVMCKHVGLHKTRSKIDTFACHSKTPEMFECKFCAFETNLKVGLTEHLRVSHEGKEENEELENIFKPYRCINCNFEPHSVLVLTKHVDNCNAIFRDNLSKEPGTVHDGKKVCTVENDKWYEFISSKGVKCHKCKHCHYRTSYKKSIKKHFAGVHGKQCELKRHFTRHIVIKHENPEDFNWFQCDHCPHKTKNKSNLKRHIIRVHLNLEDIYWFQCEHCVFKAKEKQHLKDHVTRIHTNLEDINWFQCGHCAYKSKAKSYLRQHIMRRHLNPENINWFQCEHCGFKTKLKATLKRHVMRIHLGLRHANTNININTNTNTWFQCDHCPYKTKAKSSLKRHIMRRHKLVPMWALCV